MAAINTGNLPILGDKVMKIEVHAEGVEIYFESGASVFFYHNSNFVNRTEANNEGAN